MVWWVVWQSLAWGREGVEGGTAPPIDALSFRPALDARTFLRTVDADLPVQGAVWGVVAGYALDPVVYRSWSGETVDVLGDFATLNAYAGVRARRSRIGFDLPVVARAWGGAAGDVSGIGDLRFDVKTRWNNIEDRWGVATVLRSTLPTATRPGLGSRGPTAEGLAAFDIDFGPVNLALGAGWGWASPVDLEGTVVGARATAQAGVAWSSSSAWGLAAEGGMAVGTAGSPTVSGEATLGGWFRPGDGDWVVRPAVALGLTDTPGTPRGRALLGFARDPSRVRRPADRDTDQLADTADVCPDQAEDLDQFEDADGCPEPTRVRVLLVDSAGAPVSPEVGWTSSSGHYGTAGSLVSLPVGEVVFQAGGDPVAFVVPPGPPVEVTVVVPAARSPFVVTVTDRKGETVDDARWVLLGELKAEGSSGEAKKVRPGRYTVEVSAPGLRTYRAEIEIPEKGRSLDVQMQSSRARIARGRIELSDTLSFDGRSRIASSSLPLVDDIADLLKAHPEIRRVRIDAHTGTGGDVWQNQAVSDARASAVREALIRRGISRNRLDAIGYGGSRPLVEGTGAAADARNRRIELIITGIAPRGK